MKKHLKWVGETKKMKSKDNIGNSSNEIAQGLHELYQKYNCESELPAYSNLVSKLDKVGPSVREAIQIELNRDYISLLSLEEAALQIEKDEKDCSFLERLLECLGTIACGGVLYATAEETSPYEEQRSFAWKVKAAYGALCTIPTAVKVFLKPKKEEAKETMERHNKDARKVFVGFKNNLEYFLGKGAKTD